MRLPRSSFSLVLAGLAATVAIACAPARDPVAQTTPPPTAVRKANPAAPAGDGKEVRPSNTLVWKKNRPANVELTLVEKKEAAAEGKQVSTYDMSYKPDPPDVVIELAAAPGTRAVQVTAIERTWTLAFGGADDVVIGPTKVPIAPVLVPAAPSQGDGLPVEVRVALDVAVLRRHFTDPDPAKRPIRASCSIQFYNEADGKVFGTGTNVELKVPIPVIVK